GGCASNHSDKHANLPPPLSRPRPGSDTSKPQVPPDLLLHPSARPVGVSAQLRYSAGAGEGQCNDISGLPRVRVFVQPFAVLPVESSTAPIDDKHATFGQGVDVCFNDFGQGPVRVVVKGPNGRTRTGVLHRLLPSDHNSGGWLAYDWLPDLDSSWRIGRYSIYAQAGPRRANASFVLIPAATSGLRVVGPSTDPGNNQVPPNSFAKIFLTGMHARTAQLVIYRAKSWGTPAAYFSSANVAIPPSGNGVVKLRTGTPN